MNIANIIEESAIKFPSRKALIFDKNVYTYKELNESVNKRANLLKQEYGIQKGSKVGILLNNCPEYIIFSLAVIKTGAAIIPINRFLTPHEVSYIINDSDMSYLISSSDYREHFDKINNECESLKKILILDNAFQNNNVENLNNKHELYSSGNLNVAIEENSLAVIIFTSGTTGYPKGAMLSHKNLITNVVDCTTAIKVTHKDNLLLVLPMFHSFTFTVCVLMPLAKGASIIGMPSIKPFSNVLKTILLKRISIFICIPKVYDILSEKKLPFLLRLLLNVRVCISGSAPLSGKTLESFKKNIGLPLLEGYGLSETSPVVSVNPIDGEQRAGSVGLPVGNVKVKIIDDDFNELPIGQAGEIAVYGDNVMSGYYNKIEDTAEAIVNGWFRTGDIGKIDKDGYIYIVDRKKDMILMQGMNIYPREIEEVILSHPSVEEAAVVGTKDENHGEIPIAFIVKKTGSAINKKDIIKYCKERLAAYKCPRKFEFIEKLPRSAVGKILKKDLVNKLKQNGPV